MLSHSRFSTSRAGVPELGADNNDDDIGSNVAGETGLNDCAFGRIALSLWMIPGASGTCEENEDEEVWKTRIRRFLKDQLQTYCSKETLMK